MRLIAPSILSADFGRLADEVAQVTSAGADWIHVDVMDGHFVPPITLGPLVLAAVRKATSLPLDVHLMIEHPERQLELFRQGGADRITIHAESCPDVPAIVRTIRDLGALPGLALNPRTPLGSVRPYLPLVDLLRVMTVQPGWGGQPVFEGSFAKIAAAVALRRDTGARCLIEVDGGVKLDNAHDFVTAGAEVLVAGSAIFGHPDYRPIIDGLRHA